MGVPEAVARLESLGSHTDPSCLEVGNDPDAMHEIDHLMKEKNAWYEHQPRHPQWHVIRLRNKPKRYLVSVSKLTNPKPITLSVIL